jgi:hypothetical protein
MLKELQVNFILNKQSVAILVGGEHRVFSADTPEYTKAKALISTGDEVGLADLVLGLKRMVEKIPQYIGFTVKENLVFINDEPVPSYFGERLKAFADEGLDYQPLIKFWDNLKKNPSWRSVQTLYNFLENTHCPITDQGLIQCFKAVTHNFKDKHTNKIDNSPGTVVKMERRLISDDPDKGCHVGLHAGSVSYVRGFANSSDKIVEVLINPAHVVCVPNDCSFGKMRVEEYTVVREVPRDGLVEPVNQLYDYVPSE